MGSGRRKRKADRDQANLQSMVEEVGGGERVRGRMWERKKCVDEGGTRRKTLEGELRFSPREQDILGQAWSATICLCWFRKGKAALRDDGTGAGSSS